MYIYSSHLGGLYTSINKQDFDHLYCETCGDVDWLVGYATNRKEAWELLKEDTATFDPSVCNGCQYDGDSDYCNEYCEEFQHSGGWALEYIEEFLMENWEA